MDTFNLEANGGLWSARLTLLKTKHHVGMRAKTYVVRVQLRTAQGNYWDHIVEDDSVFQFNPETWRNLCALRAGNMDDRSIQSVVDRMK